MTSTRFKLHIPAAFMKLRIPPALALWIAAPVFGEVFSGSTRLNEFFNPFTFVTEAMLYGCGAILVRELVVRWKKGWLAMLLLGMAYGIYEEGMVVQSLFDPTWHDLGVLATYGRAAGVNWVWAEHLTIFHALISISASITFVEILYSSQRGDLWVRSRSWWMVNWLAFLTVLLLWKLDIKYDSGAWQLVCVLTIILLAGLARILPGRILPPMHKPVPRPARFWWAGFLAYFAQLLLIYVFSSKGTLPFPALMLLVFLFDIFVLWLVSRWNGNGVSWDDRHRLALINGALCFFLIFGPLATNGKYPIMYFSSPLLLILMWLVYIWVARRIAVQPTSAPPSI